MNVSRWLQKAYIKITAMSVATLTILNQLTQDAQGAPVAYRRNITHAQCMEECPQNYWNHCDSICELLYQKIKNDIGIINTNTSHQPHKPEVITTKATTTILLTTETTEGTIQESGLSDTSQTITILGVTTAIQMGLLAGYGITQCIKKYCCRKEINKTHEDAEIGESSREEYPDNIAVTTEIDHNPKKKKVRFSYRHHYCKKTEIDMKYAESLYADQDMTEQTEMSHRGLQDIPWQKNILILSEEEINALRIMQDILSLTNRQASGLQNNTYQKALWKSDPKHMMVRCHYKLGEFTEKNIIERHNSPLNTSSYYANSFLISYIRQHSHTLSEEIKKMASAHDKTSSSDREDMQTTRETLTKKQECLSEYIRAIKKNQGNRKKQIAYAMAVKEDLILPCLELITCDGINNTQTHHRKQKNQTAPLITNNNMRNDIQDHAKETLSHKGILRQSKTSLSMDETVSRARLLDAITEVSEDIRCTEERLNNPLNDPSIHQKDTINNQKALTIQKKIRTRLQDLSKHDRKTVREHYQEQIDQKKRQLSEIHITAARREEIVEALDTFEKQIEDPTESYLENTQHIKLILSLYNESETLFAEFQTLTLKIDNIQTME